MSEESRLGREQIETAYALKQITDAGVRVFFYLEDREAKLSDATGKLLEGVRNYAAEMEREKARQRTIDTLKGKARQGHVIGGRVFAYENHRDNGHVTRVPIPEQSAVIKQIFERYVQGHSLSQITRSLNTVGAPCPSKSGGWQPGGWTIGSVRETLHRRTYRGEVSSRWGSEVITVQVEAMRIIPEPLWTAAQARLSEVKDSYLRSTGGCLYGRPASSFDSPYLLTSMLACGSCHATMTVRSRKHGRQRSYVYMCTSNIHGRVRQRAAKQCTNAMPLSLPAADAAILSTVESTLLRPEVIVATIQETLRRLDPIRRASRSQDLTLERARISKEMDKLVLGVAQGGELPALLDGIKQREARLHDIDRELTQLAKTDALATVNLAALEGQLREKLQDWRGLLNRNVLAARQIIGKLILGKLTVTPTKDGRYKFEGVGRLAPVLRGLIPSFGSTSLVAPTGFEPVFHP